MPIPPTPTRKTMGDAFLCEALFSQRTVQTVNPNQTARPANSKSLYTTKSYRAVWTIVA
jgi:hypothetical protein